MRKSYLLYLKVITTVTTLCLVTGLTYVSKQGRVAELLHPALPLTNVENYWREAETREGFMEVEKILGDPKTTHHPVHWGEEGEVGGERE